MERDQGAARVADGERDEATARQAGSDHGASHLAPEPPDDDVEFERQMALGRASMRKHRATLAALAESERRDREADTGSANVRRGLA